MLEQQERGTVQTDGGLAGARAALHHQALIEWRADDHVLLGLNRGDDLAHRARARRADLGEHRVGHAGRGHGVGVVELLIEVCRQITLDHREPSPVAEAERVDTGRPVERRGDGCPPVDDNGIVGIVFDVSPADVPTVLVLVGDATEEVAGAGAVEIFQRLRDRHLDVLRRDVVGRCRGVDGPEALDHRITAPTGEREVVSFHCKFGKQVGIHGVANSS